MIVLGIETSCDETSAAVLADEQVLSSVISSQAVHLKFGGVVPELASRAHLKKVIPIVEEALQRAGTTLGEIDAFAVTHGPGLVGALMVGLNYVKGLSLALDKPFVGVNHIEGHVYSNFLNATGLDVPFICLIVSGGHTQIVLVKEHLGYRLIGQTRDDAVGEAFDKVARVLGLPYPGGPQIDQLAAKGDSRYCRFPVGLKGEKTFDFSYSGLKTAVLNRVEKLSAAQLAGHLSDICAAFRQAAVQPLVERTVEAARTYQVRDIAVAGGVAANSLLREWMKQEAEKFHITVHFPAPSFCTDNAAMIARAGLERLRRGFTSDLELSAYPSLQLVRHRGSE